MPSKQQVWLPCDGPPSCFCKVRACDWRELTAGLWDRLIGFKQQVGLMAQGQQRGLDLTGKVFAFREPSQQLLVRGGRLSSRLVNC